MRVVSFFGALVLASGVVACGDHYEGGGRRNEVPTDSSSSGGPALGTGDGTSTHGGATSNGGAGGAAGTGGYSGTFPFPFGGSVSSAGSGGTGGG